MPRWPFNRDINFTLSENFHLQFVKRIAMVSLPTKEVAMSEDKINSPHHATFSQRLQISMNAKGLSASELARRVEVTPTAVWNWLQGNTFPRQNTLTWLAGVLGVTDDWLRDGGEGATGGSNPDAPSVADLILTLRTKVATLSGCTMANVKVEVTMVGQ